MTGKKTHKFHIFKLYLIEKFHMINYYIVVSSLFNTIMYQLSNKYKIYHNIYKPDKLFIIKILNLIYKIKYKIKLNRQCIRYKWI